MYSDDHCTTTLTDSRIPPPLEGPHYTRSLALLNCGSRGPAPYIGPHTVSGTFLIIPENSGTLYMRPFLDRSRQLPQPASTDASTYLGLLECGLTPSSAVLTGDGPA